MIEFEGSYYFINDYNKLAKNTSIYLSEKFTSAYGLPAAQYTFDADGKMVIKHGIIGDYLYLDGVMQRAYQLIEFEGSYYFINDYNKLAKNTSIYLSEKFTSAYGLPAAQYTFDADGKMVIKHGVVGDYLYINHIMQRAYQLIEFEGSYYFINDYNKLARNATIYLSERFVKDKTFVDGSALGIGYYTFDADGKMVIN